jgi:hypothetical protein
MARSRRIGWLGGMALAALLAGAGPGQAQTVQTQTLPAQTPVETPGPVLTSPFDISFCLCLEREIQTRQAELTVRGNAYEGLAKEIREIEAALDRERPRVDVNDQAAVDAFRQRLERLDALKARQDQVTLPDYHAAATSYNERVAQYTQRCSGRPLDPAAAEQVRASLVCRLDQ